MTKKGFEKALEELAKKKEITVLSPIKIEHKHIRTEDATGIATGMAIEGKTPFAISTNALAKNWEQIKTLCENNQNVKIIDLDEATEDLTFLRAFPNIRVIVPADNHEAKKATIAAATAKGPAYIKLLKEKKQITTEKTPFTIGRMEIMRAGKDCTIITTGPDLHDALIAAERLAEQEIECTVLNCHTIKPIDKHALISSARLTGCIVTTEITGCAVAETIGQNYPVPIKITTPDRITTEVKNAVMQKCEICMEVPEEHGKLKIEIKPELYFRLHNGGIIKSIPGLKKALLEMDDKTFTYHRNTNKNDFSTWIKEAFDEPLLAKNLEKMNTRLGMMLELIKW